ncbi:MAG: hypothetical protein AMXMBFR53_25660 [Gemmatimonadota bacterium]
MRSMIVAGIVLLGVAACARPDAESEEGAPEPAAVAVVPAEARFVARDFAFEGPDTIAAGMTTLVLANEGPNLHHLQLFRLTDGMTVADIEAGLAEMKPTDPPPPWMIPAGGVNPPDPGAETRATLMMEPGEYAVLCVVDIPDHVPHLMKGMIQPLTVMPASGPPAPAPTETLTLDLVDYAFGFSAAPTAGHHVVKVVNAGPQPHEVAFFRLKPGKTMDDFAAWGATYEGEAPVESIGGAAAMAVGQVEYVELDLTPGEYIAACFVFDGGDGRPHLLHGMVLPFTVT